MNCTKCNAELRDGDKFCPECGTPVVPAVPETPEEVTQLAPEPDPVPEQAVPQPEPVVVPPVAPVVPPQQAQAAQPQQQYQQPQQPQQQYQQPYPQQKKSGGGKGWIIGLLAALLVALLGGAAWLFLTDNEWNPLKNKEKAEQSQVKKSSDDDSDSKAKKKSKKSKKAKVKEDAEEDYELIEPEKKETVVVEKKVVVEKEVPVYQEVPVYKDAPAVAPPPPPRNTTKVYYAGCGLYPEASQRYLDPSELYGMTSWEKKIMRNEIYARHGYIFQTSDMRNYFNSQPWYSPVSKNVTLSKIEQYNVNLIKSVE